MVHMIVVFISYYLSYVLLLSMVLFLNVYIIHIVCDVDVLVMIMCLCVVMLCYCYANSFYLLCTCYVCSRWSSGSRPRRWG